ncbi:Serine/threonine-protein kinase sid1 like protein [Argiope bruennichi]|uniref:Serine/threonine-protein kinase sid1 like protein n=1 Tax=Argiope bruennichi TaxID=94029 RepID=A0A8T0ER31_ARGBR|nr:Serine/threonine-protein kinase sid1 like protein [Argiope bruennichi]
MNEYQSSESRLNSLWSINGNKRYSLKKFINNGKFITHILFKDKYKDRDVIGKVVMSFSEGEVFHWPRLYHRSLAPLLDVVSIGANISILISTYDEIKLREIVHNEDFVNSQSCFTNKKIYLQDVLWGLDYLHRNSLVLMNMSDANVYICLESNKAVITDFSCLKSICQAKKHKFPLPPFYQAPEVSEPNNVHNKYCTFNPIAAEIWAFGVMTLEVFLQHRVPWALVDYNCSRALEIVNYIDSDTLKIANKGSIVLDEDSINFKEFLNLFLTYHPYNRCDARRAALAMFLQPTRQRIAQEISKSCNQQRNERTEGKGTGDGSIALKYLSSTESSQVISKSHNLHISERADKKVKSDSSVEMKSLLTSKSSETLHSSKHRLTSQFSLLELESSSKKSNSNAGLSSKTSREHLPVADSYSIYENTREQLISMQTKEVPSIRKVHSSNYPNRKGIQHVQKFNDDTTHQISENMSDKGSLHSVNIQQESTQSTLCNQMTESTRSCSMRKNELDRSKSESFSSSRIEESRSIQRYKNSLINLKTERNHNSNEVADNEAFENDQLSQSRRYCPRSQSLYFHSFGHESRNSYISLRNLQPSKRNSTNRMKMNETSSLVQSAPALGYFRKTSDFKKSDMPISTLNIKRKKSKKSWKCMVENENGQIEVHNHSNQSTKNDSRLQNSSRNEKETDLRLVVCENQPFELTGKWKRLHETNIIENSHCILRNRFHCPVHSKIKSSNSFQQNRDIKEESHQSPEQPKKWKSSHLFKSGPLSNCYYSQISENFKPPNSGVEFTGTNKIINFRKKHRKYSKKYSYKQVVNADDNPSDLISVDGFTLNRSQSIEKKRKKKLRKRCLIHIEVVSQKCSKVHAKDIQPMTAAAKKRDTCQKHDKTQKDSTKQRRKKCHEVKIEENLNLSPITQDNASTQTVISRRSFTILTAESANNHADPKDKHKDKRKSIKKTALYCLCLGSE